MLTTSGSVRLQGSSFALFRIQIMGTRTFLRNKPEGSKVYPQTTLSGPQQANMTRMVFHMLWTIMTKKMEVYMPLVSSSKAAVNQFHQLMMFLLILICKCPVRWFLNLKLKLTSLAFRRLIKRLLWNSFVASFLFYLQYLLHYFGSRIRMNATISYQLNVLINHNDVYCWFDNVVNQGYD